jgi:GT2 family glycosyltransferase
MKSSPSKISVIIVSWNVAASLKRCLQSVLKTQYPNLEIFVIDNHSADASVAVADSFKTSGVQVVTNFGNLGFPKAVNQGLNRATGDYYLLLNPDARLPKNFFLRSLDFFAKHQDAFVMGVKLLDPDGRTQGSVFPEPSVINTLKEFWFGQRGLTLKYSPAGDKPVPVNAVSGACMFFPKRTLDTIGRFTEEVFMYYEDLDFCRRIRRYGGKVYFHPGIEVVHEHGQSAIQTAGADGNYLNSSSLWYNGPVKHYLIWFIIRVSQLLTGK